ncbi:MAG: hypothetical protein UT34_C0001G0413 [candidate division WS6 bacterium GW2011_GWF2_39_15]|uniref:Succinylglutamate desuccinylase/aspartoacylase n=1 Tax=candidate division WS6 bacterium GW2011_GWF2_39_15 TaxID=1619100 RepID=A0A0G0MT75_9BACT|nr:MAG: hypothetical protein UT34_C0001G0413 [candidate division WS6 bacterium GW2011_GWF2_39_15]
MAEIIKKNHKGIEYWVKGTNPKLLILSGTHGDEYGVIEHIREYIENNELPDFIYVPEVSPSAVHLKTRKNINGVDLNRSFKKGVTEPEAIANMEIVQGQHFDKCITFHEDLEDRGVPQYYIYDCTTCSENDNNGYLDQMRRDLLSKGYQALNGIDDTEDPGLGHVAVDGYISIPGDYTDDSHGTYETWGIVNKVFKRYLNPEVPSMLSPAQKKEMVNIMFKYFLQA